MFFHDVGVIDHEPRCFRWIQWNGNGSGIALIYEGSFADRVECASKLFALQAGERERFEDFCTDYTEDYGLPSRHHGAFPRNITKSWEPEPIAPEKMKKAPLLMYRELRSEADMHNIIWAMENGYLVITYLADEAVNYKNNILESLTNSGMAPLDYQLREKKIFEVEETIQL